MEDFSLPILTGKDAGRFLDKINNPVKVSESTRKRIIDNYNKITQIGLKDK